MVDKAKLAFIFDLSQHGDVRLKARGTVRSAVYRPRYGTGRGLDFSRYVSGVKFSPRVILYTNDLLRRSLSLVTLNVDQPVRSRDCGSQST